MNRKHHGKELQDELDLTWLDYGARMYHGDIGRWTVTDPLSEKYLSFSPYHFSGNNPVMNVDPDGMAYDLFGSGGGGGSGYNLVTQGITGTNGDREQFSQSEQGGKVEVTASPRHGSQAAAHAVVTNQGLR